MTEGSASVSRRAVLRAGAGATAVTAAAGTAAGQEGEGGGGGSSRPEWPSYVSDATDEGYEDLRGQGEVTIEVGPGGNFSFAPTFVWVDPDTSITWEFASPTHNVKFESQPDGASLEGTPGGTFETVPQGATHTVTPDTGGMYTYFCGPHEGQGMKGAIAVGEDVPTVSTGGEGGGGAPTVPDAAKSLGIAASFAMAATLGLAYFFIKFGGPGGPTDDG